MMGKISLAEFNEIYSYARQVDVESAILKIFQIQLQRGQPMELSVEEKIQAAIQPLIDRITALQTQSQNFKQEIVALQTANQSKAPHKPEYKPVGPRNERVHTTKPTKRSADHHDEKPETKPVPRPGLKKEEVKIEHEAGKVDNNKVKTPTAVSKVGPSPNVNKDNNKGRPSTGFGSKPNEGLSGNKSGLLDKKPIHHKSNEAAHEKKEDQEKKEHHSKEKETSKVVPGLKSPGPPKKVVDKKSVVPPMTGKKPVPVKPEIKPTNPVKPIPDAKVAKIADIHPLTDAPIPDEVKIESVALNNPYTPQEQAVEKKEEQKVEIVSEEPQPAEQAEEVVEVAPQAEKVEEKHPQQSF